jgi:hexosaminidase
VIPEPVSMTLGEGEFVFDESSGVVAGPGVESVAELLRSELSRGTGLPWAGSSGISLSVDGALADEEYRLEVDVAGVRIVGGSPTGVFYGTRTLLQLLPVEVFGGGSARWAAPAVRVEDRPALGWRGAMLDVGRHFFSKDYVLRFVDVLALHKLNVLHLHLSEDQGWRVQIRRYPRLTEVGAWRSETIIGHPNREHPENDRYDETPHGGFYTQDELAEIVAYAGARGVRVVPEIDLPGHSQAAIAAYPELGNSGEPVPVLTRWGINPVVLNVEESTVEFYRNVFDELFEIFPDSFAHVGGDECPRDEWRASARAQARKRELGLADEDELQSWFIRQLDEHFAARGRRLVGWDEILEGGLAPGAVVMSWRGEEGGIAAAKAGHDVVMAPRHFTYFDYYQSEDHDSEPDAIGGYLPLEKAYSYQPIPAELSAEEAAHVLGAQFQLWSEYIPTPERMDYMAFPRGSAFAEVAWRGGPVSYAGFLDRLRVHLRRLDGLGVGYRPLD